MLTYGPSIIFGDLNSRVYSISAGEEKYIGPHSLINTVQNVSPQANRYLLLELCVQAGLAIANGFFKHDLEETVTYYDVGTDKRQPASADAFAQLDVSLVPLHWFGHVLDVRSTREAPLASHHFLTMMQFKAKVEKKFSSTAVSQLDLRSLQDPFVSMAFARRFSELSQESAAKRAPQESQGNVDDANQRLCKAFVEAAANTLPSTEAKKKRPWISIQTLQLIESRFEARFCINLLP